MSKRSSNKPKTKTMVITQRVVMGSKPEDTDKNPKHKSRLYFGDEVEMTIKEAKKAQDDGWAKPKMAEVTKADEEEEKKEDFNPTK